jgi:UbiD family decarboxylase
MPKWLRLALTSRHRLRCLGARLPVPEHDIAVHLTHAEERGEDLPVYITLGTSPLMEIAASMPILYNQSE